MRVFQWFTKQMKSEPRKKKHQWIVGEDKILDIVESDLLRHSCRKPKERGINEKKFYLVRDWFMIELGLFTGLRVDEMRQLKIGDILIKGKQSSIIVQKGKGDKKRCVWINDGFKQTCLEFLQIRKKFRLDNEPESFILSSTAESPISKRTLQKSFKRCIRRVKLSEKYSIHCLRHTYGTFLLKASRNIKLVKEQLGHSSIKTTEIYISLIADETKEALEKLYEEPICKSSPRARKSIRKTRRLIAPKLNITDNFDSLPDEAWDEIYKRLAELMVNHISEKDFERFKE
ncbi:MAG: site-specific integrase [Candidatus Omnitrophica bacterium]|nr:site-specific integrase [Candidatus Omnitrophota bacterium]